MARDAIRIGLLADFNVQNLAALLTRHAGDCDVTCTQGPFGQTAGILLDERAPFWSESGDVLVLWTRPERAVPSFAKLLSFEPVSVEAALDEVDAFAALVRRIPQSVRTIAIPTWVVPVPDQSSGPLDLASGVGSANVLMRMNLRLIEALDGERRVVFLDATRWTSAAGDASFSPTLWYLSKTPFHPRVFQEAATDLLAAIDGVRGRSKKVLLLDLDNTLWGGVVGDVGWEKLRLGGHDAIGEAFVDFQKALKRLSNRGIALALVSKNEESVALEAIRRHPEMVLGPDDFAGWRINWQDKAANIVDLLAELNLGVDSAVFLDDSPFERGRVREALPQVLVPEMPGDPTQYPLFLSRLKCFNNPLATEEDRGRTRMYVADRGRTALRKQIDSLDEWLEMLALNVTVEPLNAKSLDRAAQLFNKTNQMNLSTRRLGPSDLLAWADAEGHALWTFRVADRFGEYGLCGIASLVRHGNEGQILDFILSCRVMARGVEEAMLATVIEHARSAGCEQVWTEYLPTAKNQPCWKWLQRLEARTQGHRVFFPATGTVPCPRHITRTSVNLDEQVTI